MRSFMEAHGMFPRAGGMMLCAVSGGKDSTQMETINKYLKYVPADKVTLEKLNKFRTKVGNLEICL